MLGAEERFGKGLEHATETAQDEEAPGQGDAAAPVSISEAPPKGELAGGHFRVGRPRCSEMSNGRIDSSWDGYVTITTYTRDLGVSMSPQMPTLCSLPRTQEHGWQARTRPP